MATRSPWPTGASWACGGRESDPINRSRLDPKDRYGWQSNNSPDRLTRPLIRRDCELTDSEGVFVAFRSGV